jgi:hypothetical protein
MTKPHWLDRPENHRKLWIGFIVVLACTVLAEFLWPIHGHFEIESITGFNALYGFGACAAMVASAKLLGLWLKRSDTFYASEDSESTSSADNSKGVAHE